jgi:hypothetical protein
MQIFRLIGGRCKKKGSDFSVPRRDVTDQTLPGRDFLNYSLPQSLVIFSPALLSAVHLVQQLICMSNEHLLISQEIGSKAGTARVAYNSFIMLSGSK